MAYGACTWINGVSRNFSGLDVETEMGCSVVKTARLVDVGNFRCGNYLRD